MLLLLLLLLFLLYKYIIIHVFPFLLFVLSISLSLHMDDRMERNRMILVFPCSRSLLEFHCLLWTKTAQQQRKHMEARRSCIARLPPRADTRRVPRSPRQQHAGREPFPRSLSVSQVHAVILLRALDGRAAVATLSQLSGGCPCVLPPRLRSQIGPHPFCLTTTPPPPRHPPPPPPPRTPTPGGGTHTRGGGGGGGGRG